MRAHIPSGGDEVSAETAVAILDGWTDRSIIAIVAPNTARERRVLGIWTRPEPRHYAITSSAGRVRERFVISADDIVSAYWDPLADEERRTDDDEILVLTLSDSTTLLIGPNSSPAT